MSMMALPGAKEVGMVNQVFLPEPWTMPKENEALYEIVQGQRVELPPMSGYAHWIAGRLQNRLGPHVEMRKLGHVVPENLFVFNAQTDERRRPDVAYFSVEQWPLDRPLPEAGDWAIVPELAVEVISPHDVFAQVLAKLQEYFDYGVKQVWLVVPNVRKMYVFDSPTQVRIFSDADTLDNTVVPGFSLKVGELFQAVSAS